MALLLLGGHTAIAQEKIKGENKPGYDDKPIHYGFYLALPATRYNLQHSQWYADQLAGADASGADYLTANTKTNFGLYTGLVLNVRLAQYLDARFVPGVGFYGRPIVFTNTRAEDEEDIQTVSSTVVELPLLLKYKARRRGNFRMYFVGGLKPAIDLGSGKNSPENVDENLIQVNKYDLAIEYGVGLDIFYPYFKFAPELRFSQGLLNMHKPINDDAQTYSRSIDRLTTRNVSLILFFE
ncbi:porin family protein [Pontibacter chitinilyticus]|uniref:type IX secretion/gliding motility protein PorT/SprT n=1 Tax=Pontibacter chitinilyticus TaxID=2674989 RepID=UPI00321A0547